MKFKIISGLFLFCLAAVVFFVYVNANRSAPSTNDVTSTVSHPERNKGAEKHSANKPVKKASVSNSGSTIAGTKTEESEENEIVPYSLMDQDLLEYRAMRDEAIAEVFWDEVIPAFNKIHEADVHDKVRTIAAKSALTRILEDDFHDSDILDCDCRVTLCKVVIRHPNMETYERFNNKPIDTEPMWRDSAKSGTHQELENGEIEATFYFSRKDNAMAVEELVADTVYQGLLNS